MDNQNSSGSKGNKQHVSSVQPVYRIKVKGLLDCHWSEWFDGWTITPNKDGTTMLIGPVADQAVLHGLFAKMRNLNLELVYVHRMDLDAKRISEESSG
jgi:hypothetical protein